MAEIQASLNRKIFSAKVSALESLVLRRIVEIDFPCLNLVGSAGSQFLVSKMS